MEVKVSGTPTDDKSINVDTIAPAGEKYPHPGNSACRRLLLATGGIAAFSRTGSRLRLVRPISFLALVQPPHVKIHREGADHEKTPSIDRRCSPRVDGYYPLCRSRFDSKWIARVQPSRGARYRPGHEG